MQKTMKNTYISTALLSLALGCSSPEETRMSAWSDSIDGLQLQITSPAHFKRMETGVAMLHATCTISNSSSNAKDITHLARLYLVDVAGTTNPCQRSEDVADMLPARPTVVPGQTTSWVQDGQAATSAGTYNMFVVWDGDKNLKSPHVAITIE